MSNFFILYCVDESGATWLEIAWPLWALYHTVCLLSCHRRSKSLLALYHIHLHVCSNRGFIWFSNSLSTARNIWFRFQHVKIFCFTLFFVRDNEKEVYVDTIVVLRSLWPFDTHHVYHIIPDDKRVISQKHNTKLYWLLSLGCDTLDEPSSATLPFCLARKRPGAVYWIFMLQPFWAIWVEKMGFFASRIAVTLFLTLWICRTQGQHGGMENQSKLHSPIFSYLRFSSSAFVWSRTTLISDSSRNTWHTPACTFQRCFLVKINEKSLLLSCSFHCMRIVGFFCHFCWRSHDRQRWKRYCIREYHLVLQKWCFFTWKEVTGLLCSANRFVLCG